MARLDWQKVYHKSQAEVNSTPEEKDIKADLYYKHKQFKKTLKTGIWPSGKHSGTRVNELPVNYLIWAGQHLHINYLKQQANNELLRRYYTGEIKLDNT